VPGKQQEAGTQNKKDSTFHGQVVCQINDSKQLKIAEFAALSNSRQHLFTKHGRVELFYAEKIQRGLQTAKDLNRQKQIDSRALREAGTDTEQAAGQIGIVNESSHFFNLNDQDMQDEKKYEVKFTRAGARKASGSRIFTDKPAAEAYLERYTPKDKKDKEEEWGVGESALLQLSEVPVNENQLVTERKELKSLHVQEQDIID
jgi:hypothetical protein